MRETKDVPNKFPNSPPVTVYFTKVYRPALPTATELGVPAPRKRIFRATSAAVLITSSTRTLN